MPLLSWLEGVAIEPDGKIQPYDIVSKDFSLHPLITTERDFPDCCEDHSLSFKEIKEWAITFLPEEEAIKLAKKTILNFANTEGFILFNFNEDDWYEDISDFIEYNIHSFGGSINHAERYLIKLGGFIRSIQIPNNYHKSKKLDNLTFQWLMNSMFGRDLFHLRKTFDKWFYSFPFEISFLNELKDKYDLFFGIVNDDFTDFDDSSFMTELNKMTDAILTHHNTSILYKHGKLTDPSKIKSELITSQRTHQLSNLNFYGKESESDPEYRRMIQKWFEDERKFIDDVISLGNSSPINRSGSLDLSTSAIKAGKAEQSANTKSGKPKNVGVHKASGNINSGKFTLNQICIALFCMQVFKESPEAKIIIKKYYGSENPASLKNHNIVSKSQFISLENLDKDKWKKEDLQKVLRIVTSENHSIGIENASQYWKEFWADYTKHYKTDSD